MLSILIPTYNRSPFLLRNLTILSEIVYSGNWENEIEIVLSNNCSTDDTSAILEQFIRDNELLSVRLFHQSKNIGLEQNALFVLEKASRKFVMYLGDDDFLNFDYFKKVLEVLSLNDINCIIPSYVPILPSGERLPGSKGRDIETATKYYDRGFSNCLENSWRGHQLSGLVFKIDELYDIYQRQKVSNLYPFIFFTAISCLKGRTLLLTEFPILVTQPGQQNKDWGYGDIGLLDEIFDNYYKIELSSFQITRLQFKILDKQIWRIKNSLSKGKKSFARTLFNTWICRNSTLYFKIYFPFFIFFRFTRSIFR